MPAPGEEEANLLADVKRAVVTWGGELRRSYSDDHGEYALRFEYRGETFIAVAKMQPERGLASFMQKVARRAAGQEVLLVEFFGEEPTLSDAYVFDPDTVLEESDESQGASKKEVPTDWYELPLAKGVLLGDFVSGREKPPEPSTAGPRPTAITDYC